ncbi:unnamed protein product [Urochloa humidicola]
MVAAGSSPAILVGNRARRLEMLGVDLLGPASDAAPWRRRGDPGGGAARAAACSQGRREVDAGGVVCVAMRGAAPPFATSSLGHSPATSTHQDYTWSIYWIRSKMLP